MASSMVKEPMSPMEQPKSDIYTPLLEANEREMEALDAERLDAVAVSDFTRAAKAEAKLKKLQARADKYARAALLDRQQEDCDQLEAEYSRAVAAIKAAYQDDIDEVDARAFELSEDLETESKNEIDRLMRHTPPPKLHFSKQLLALRDKAQKLGKKRDYEEAAKVQEQADLLEEKETAVLREKHKQKLERMYDRIKKKHEDDLSALEDKAERSKLQQTKYFKIEIQRLKDKYQRLASELEHQHALERYKLSSANTAGGSHFVSKRNSMTPKGSRKPRPWDKGTPITPRTPRSPASQSSPVRRSGTASSRASIATPGRRESGTRRVSTGRPPSSQKKTPKKRESNITVSPQQQQLALAKSSPASSPASKARSTKSRDSIGATKVSRTASNATTVSRRQSLRLTASATAPNRAIVEPFSASAVFGGVQPAPMYAPYQPAGFPMYGSVASMPMAPPGFAFGGMPGGYPMPARTSTVSAASHGSGTYMLGAMPTHGSLRATPSFSGAGLGGYY